RGWAPGLRGGRLCAPRARAPPPAPAPGGLRRGARAPRGTPAIRSRAVQRISRAPRPCGQDPLPDGAALRGLSAALRSPGPRPGPLNAPAPATDAPAIVVRPSSTTPALHTRARSAPWQRDNAQKLRVSEGLTTLAGAPASRPLARSARDASIIAIA